MRQGNMLAPKLMLTASVSFSDNCNELIQGSSTRGPGASFVRPGKGISQNTMRYEY